MWAVVSASYALAPLRARCLCDAEALRERFLEVLAGILFSVDRGYLVVREAADPRGIIQHLCDHLSGRPVFLQLHDREVAISVYGLKVYELTVRCRALSTDNHQRGVEDTDVGVQDVF